MMLSSTTVFFGLLASLIASVDAHGTMVAITGANGVTAMGMGVTADTPRDGSRANPFQRDTSVIRDREIASGRTGVCGRTSAGGDNDVSGEVAKASDAGLPSIAEDGTLTMTIHQVNQDGGGPYTCEISADATGEDFQEMTVTTNVPGLRGFSTATASDFPLVAQAPAGTNCTGGPNGDACLVRCRNNTPAGPFGSCATVTGSVSPDAAPAAADGEGGGFLGGIGAALGAGGAGTKTDAEGNPVEGGAGGLLGGAGGGLLGGLKGLLGKREVDTRKRVLKSRVVDRGLAGKWI